MTDFSPRQIEILPAAKSFLRGIALYVLFLASFALVYWCQTETIKLLLIMNTNVFQGEWWRAVTYMWLHQNFDHLYGNLMALCLEGVMAAVYFRMRTLYATFLISGIVAGLGVAYFQPWVSLLGASAGDMGLTGLAIVGAFRTWYGQGLRVPKPLVVLLRFLPWMMMIGVISQFHFDFSSTHHVSSLAHFFGLITGVICGMLIPRRSLRFFS